MSDTSEKTNLLGLSPAKMEEFFLSIGEKKFRAQQMLKWIHQYGESDFEKFDSWRHIYTRDEGEFIGVSVYHGERYWGHTPYRLRAYIYSKLPKVEVTDQRKYNMVNNVPTILGIDIAKDSTDKNWACQKICSSLKLKVFQCREEVVSKFPRLRAIYANCNVQGQ